MLVTPDSLSRDDEPTYHQTARVVIDVNSGFITLVNDVDIIRRQVSLVVVQQMALVHCRMS